MTEKQIKTIKKRILSYRAILSAEKRKFGGYDDSRGLRYDIPELHIRIKDFKGALRYFKWFDKEFSDDIGFPHFNLFWSLAYFENSKIEEATRMIYKTSFTNTYLVDLICNKNPNVIDKSELIGFESKKYAVQILKECQKNISPSFKQWLIKFSEEAPYRDVMNRFISLQKLIEDEPPGELRTSLILESQKIEDKVIGLSK